jgi:hypothetical protein
MRMQKVAKKCVFDFLHELESNRLRFDVPLEHIAMGIKMFNVARSNRKHLDKTQNRKFDSCNNVCGRDPVTKPVKTQFHRYVTPQISLLEKK